MTGQLNLPHFLFLNGPPSSGKSTLADLICSSHPAALRESFAEPIRSMIYSVFFPSDGPIEYQHNLRASEVKKQSLIKLAKLSDADEAFRGDDTTVREAMIEWSENYMKRLFGQNVFGRLLWSRCREQTLFYSTFIIDDSGFFDEAKYIISRVGLDSCHLVRLHRLGCSFSEDSRGYISLSGVQTLDLYNNGAPAEMMEILAAELGTNGSPPKTVGML